jgi:hypothetical protein
MLFDRENNHSTTCCLSSQRTIGKVAGFLSASINSKGKGEQPVTLTGISLLLGTSPESVNESLVSLRELGAIKLEHRRVVVRNMELLQTIAACD